MIRGIYTGACGMLINETRQNITANNLANVDTTGFKKDVAVFSMEPDNNIHKINDWKKEIKNRYIEHSVFIGNLGTGSVVSDVYTTKNQGEIRVTDNKTDFAISGQGYFAVETDSGVKYTRAGNFAITKDGYLTDMNGNNVLGVNPSEAAGNNSEIIGNDKTGLAMQSNAIRVDTQTPIVVDTAGVVYQNNQPVAKMLVVEFESQNNVLKNGANLISPGPDTTIKMAGNAEILQNSIEGSNVNAVYEMVNMIELQRAYEMNQKVILTQDEMLQKSINSVGRLNA